MRLSISLLLLFLLLPRPAAAQDTYTIEKVADGVYAALANPGGAATSNAFMVDLGEQMIVGGAHLTRKAVNDLIAATAELSPKPIRAFVLAHHHHGYSFVDFDVPPSKDLVMTLETRQVMKREVRQLKNPLIFFKQGLTFEGGGRTLILTNVGPAHSRGDLIAFVPESKILFTSDLIYADSAGFLGDGPLREWVIALEGIGQLQAEKVIPGYGPVGKMEQVIAFKNYLKTFLTEVLRHIERGDDMLTTVENFDLPRYRKLPGFATFTEGNVERAYRQLKGADN